MNRIQCVTNCLVLSVMAGSLMVAVNPSFGTQQTANEDERELIAILQSDAADAEKAITCKRLAIYGTSQSVEALAPLLKDPRLASWARIALEAIPGSEADAALRQAIDQLEGKLLIGAINSIGVRRDVETVDKLVMHLSDKNTEVASAAAVALGRIGNVPATAALRRMLADDSVSIRGAIAEGCILSAERLWDEGNREQAAEIYDEVRLANVPKPDVLAATRGAILVRQSAGTPLLLEQLRSPDQQFFQIGIMVARELAGQDVTETLAEEVARAEPGRAALLLLALGDRDDPAALPVVLRSAQAGSKQARIAAIRVLKQLGDASCVNALLAIATDTDKELADAAMTTLASLPGADVDRTISSRLNESQDKMLVVLLELVGRRQIDAVTDLLKAIDHPDGQARHAAITALGATVGPRDLSALIAQVTAPKSPADEPLARQALRSACLRMPDREDCAKQLIVAMAPTSPPSKIVFLEILGALEGDHALQAIAEAASGADLQLQDAATRLLGQWMTVDAGPVLLKLAEMPDHKYKVRALRGYIRLARQFNMPDRQRTQMCRNALNVATRSDEQKLVLQVLERYPSIGMLNLAVESTEVEKLREDAIRVAMILSQKMGGQSADVQKLLARIGYGPVKLEIVKAEYGAGASQQDVTKLVRQFAGDMPLIVLPSSNYNTSFGGDPLPGTAKQLKIRYRMNNKVGEASFAENAVVLLPMPK